MPSLASVATERGLRLTHPGSTRDRVIDAAANLFRARGYAAVSLRDIASAAGLSTGSVYHHFASKDEAVQEILHLGHKMVLAKVREAVDSVPEPAALADKLEAAVTAHIMSLLGENSLPAANMRIFSQVPKEIRSTTLPLRHEYEKYWTDLLSDCQHAGLISTRLDVEMPAPLLFGAMNWLLEWYEAGRYSIDAVVQQIVQLLASGAVRR